VAVASVCFVVLFVVEVARSLDTDRDLSDFASPAEARAFTSAHLPVPLPADAVIEQLHYERWTDWNFCARARLPSPDAVERYLEQAKSDRKLNDAYCYDEDPPHGARYFLADVSACGSIKLASPQVIEVHCYTR
jgi:hypothetical protein